MINFHNYLLTYHPDFDPLTGMKPTQVGIDQVSHYSEYMTLLCQQNTFLLQGRDSLSFLQGQLCGDVRQLSDQQALWTAHCSPKGRVFSTLMLVKRGDVIWVISPSSNSTDLIERLRKYILFSKLEILNPQNKPYLIEVSGENTEPALQKHFPQLPKSPMATVKNEELQIIRLHGQHPRWLILAMTDASAISIWQELTKTHCLIGQRGHQQTLIEAGLVEVGKELQEAFLPQMIGLNKVNAMSLKKGCYVGQEVIARTNNLGKLKRHLYQAQLFGNTNPSVGADLTDAHGAILGTCVNSYYNLKTQVTVILVVIAEQGLDGDLYCNGTQLQTIEKVA